MNAIKFFKVDFIRSKSQSKLFPIFAILTTLLALKFDSPIWSVFYLSFFAIILSTTPFSVQTISNSGFLNMLPASSYSRVAGRYLFALFMSVVAIIFGELSIAISYIVNRNLPKNLVSLSVLILAVTIMANSIQYVLFFGLGNIKSKQLMVIIQMIPAFAVFYGASYLSDYIKVHTEAGLQWISWSLNHLTLIALVAFVLSILMLFISLGISNFIVSKRDSMTA